MAHSGLFTGHGDSLARLTEGQLDFFDFWHGAAGLKKNNKLNKPCIRPALVFLRIASGEIALLCFNHPFTWKNKTHSKLRFCKTKVKQSGKRLRKKIRGVKPLLGVNLEPSE